MNNWHARFVSFFHRIFFYRHEDDLCDKNQLGMNHALNRDIRRFKMLKVISKIAKYKWWRDIA